MQGITRRAMLGVLGTVAGSGLVGSAAARKGGRIDRVLSTGSPVPENIGVDADGNLYVGITGGSVRRLDADRTDETDLAIDATTEVATYPGGVAGVLVADGVLYTAVNGASGGVYAVDLETDSGATELATILPDGGGFVNDLYADEATDRLLVTESFGGAVYEIPLDGDGEATVWAQDALLDTASFGANGLTRLGDDVYVNVTRAGDNGRVVRIPVEADGSAGTAETFVQGEELFGADGLTARGSQLYVAVNAGNKIVRVNPAGQTKTVVEGDPLAFPSEVVFDPTARGKAFVCNFTRTDPDRAGVLRTHP